MKVFITVMGKTKKVELGKSKKNIFRFFIY